MPNSYLCIAEAKRRALKQMGCQCVRCNHQLWLITRECRKKRWRVSISDFKHVNLPQIAKLSSFREVVASVAKVVELPVFADQTFAAQVLSHRHFCSVHQ